MNTFARGTEGTIHDRARDYDARESELTYGGLQSACTATSAIQCVDVPFDYPRKSPVVGLR
jgi:hypothetical protein